MNAQSRAGIHHAVIVSAALLMVSTSVLADDTLGDKARRVGQATGELLNNAGEAVIVTGRRALDGTREGIEQGADWTQRQFSGDSQRQGDTGPTTQTPRGDAASASPPGNDGASSERDSGVRVTPLQQ
ncbi:hypothetical protein GCM10027040_19960 [Halomonas shantousis]